MTSPPYVVLVPVKAPTIAKSRLALTAGRRAAYARAFALDTIQAARAVPEVAEVVVVSSDGAFADAAADAGVRTVPDAGDLNESLRAAARAVRSRHPAALVVALTADLPSLSPGDLAAGLAELRGSGPWFVADADGQGTTLYAASYDAFDPHFGVDSRRAHLAAGAREVRGDLPSLRRDVDRTEHLEDARRLGLGEHTTATDHR
ncbi:MAG TPA: 2-phospho-L-lactate guanylyltransferase [Nocardioides sp.]|nr:2-phospho-L-lactate guanylyltransferase [Nocardioides sp.]